jgi:N-hydroxyarylamine O-acetyltransferase
MMTDGFRLDRYLARIGLDGPVAPDLKTLAAIHAAHASAIPFENLDPLLRLPVKLDMASLQHKLVDSRRGGYCFEQNTIFGAALETIGFKVTWLGGRVRWNVPPDSPLGSRTHMLLKVDLPEGPYIADAGFGACMLDAPLRLEMNTEQTTAMGTFRLADVDGLYALSARRSAGWRTMYVFDLVPQLHADYLVGNWYTSTSPLVPFTSTLIMERIGGDRRYKLVNRRLFIEARENELLSERLLVNATELHRVLDEIFDVTPPEPAEKIFAIIEDSVAAL